MIIFIVGVIVVVVGILAVLRRRQLQPEQPHLVAAGGILAVVIGFVVVFFSTAINVGDGEGGLVVRKIFGASMTEGHIIAANGENGPQAEILPPGWHFWYWPWDYTLERVQNIQIPAGMVGVVTSKDGIPLPEGQVFADVWDDPKQMLDGKIFLTGGKGYAGPQLTVLPPASYRYNTRLFTIETKPALTVEIGEVVVVKANAGKLYDAVDEGNAVELVNGVPMVPKGFRGIWKTSLTPNMYYLHPDAYQIINVKTTNRVYSYTGSSRLGQSDRPDDDNSIGVRTKDGFEFPVDVRVSVKITAENAPYVVALLADPDADDDNDGFDTLEEIVILPAVRAIFRNSAEGRDALEYVASRSSIEETSTELFRTKIEEFKIETDGLFVADIGLSKTPEGKLLLGTQTDKETAKQEQETWAAKRDAQVARAESVKAEAEADQEKDKVTAKVQIQIKTDEGEAEAQLAQGKAKAATSLIEAVGGFDNYLTLEVAKLIIEGWSKGGKVPDVLVIGGGSGANGGLTPAVLGKMIQEMTKNKGEVDPPN